MRIFKLHISNSCSDLKGSVRVEALRVQGSWRGVSVNMLVAGLGVVWQAGLVSLQTGERWRWHCRARASYDGRRCCWRFRLCRLLRFGLAICRWICLGCADRLWHRSVSFWRGSLQLCGRQRCAMPFCKWLKLSTLVIAFGNGIFLFSMWLGM